MTDQPDYPADPSLDAALERVLARKAERATATALPLEAVLARYRSDRAVARRRLALLAAVGVLVVAAAAGLGLGWLRSNTPVGAPPSPSPSAADIAALRRPIAVPLIGPGGPCPASPVGLTLADLGGFQGTGAVRVNNLDNVPLNALPVIDGWAEEKVFWAVDARESGPILVRAVRLDGTGGISLGAGFGSELVLGNDSLSSGGAVVGPSPAYPIERVFVDSVWFREAGCYLLQMDGPATSSTVVFRAVGAAPPAVQPSPSPPGLGVDGAGIFGTQGLWALSGGQVLTSIDRGAHWQTVGPGGLSSDVLDADDVWTVTAGPGSTEQNGSSSDVLHFVVARTADGGSSWKSSSVPGTYPDTSPQVRFLDPGTGYLLAAAERQSDGVGTILRTTDGGATWQVRSTLKWAGSTFGLSDDGTLWIGANAEAGPVAHPLLIVSRDGGRTWSTTVLPGLAGRTGGPDLYVPEPPVFWTTSDGAVEVADSAGPVRLYRTTNGGRMWVLAAERQTGGEGGATEGGAFIDATTWLLAETGSAGEVIASSTDGGSSWTTVTPAVIDHSAVGILSLRFWDQTNGIAVDLEGSGSPLLVTSDGGASWAFVAGP